ncbi:MAG: kinase/pyrophosphorylase, partial [Sphingomonadales bacterium]|nr:kinase/pyrophosphorylase [Sphingomonadales bacterium]
QECKRYCARNGWPVIDVTRRSVEEVAAGIINLYQEHRDSLGYDENGDKE